MTTETTRQFLDRRERELKAQISAIRGQLAPKEAELAEIQSMKAVLSAPRLPVATSLADLGTASFGRGDPTLKLGDLGKVGETIAAIADGRPATIKECVIQALLDHFPMGASAAAIREYIRDAYGRSIDAGSLRPQMRRMKADHVLVLDQANETWNLTLTARRNYSIYNHPTSRRAMKELQDDPQEDE